MFDTGDRAFILRKRGEAQPLLTYKNYRLQGMGDEEKEIV